MYQWNLFDGRVKQAQRKTLKQKINLKTNSPAVNYQILCIYFMPMHANACQHIFTRGKMKSSC